jgi:hypothetical protein
MPNAADDYLVDLGFLLKEKALKAKQKVSSRGESQADPFDLGRLSAYYDVLSLMVSQADVFGIAPAALSLEGFDPDAELLSQN